MTIQESTNTKDNSGDSNRIGCAIRLYNSPKTLTVVNDGRFEEQAPPGVDLTATEHFPLHNHAVFYLHNPGRGAQGLQVGTRYDRYFEIWTLDGYKLAFGEGKRGDGKGPNTAACPIHTDAEHVLVWEVLVFTKLLGDAPRPAATVPDNAMPYTIQTGTGCYLQSIPGRHDSVHQPVYKSLDTAPEENYRVQFVDLPDHLQKDWDQEFAHIRAELKNKQLQEGTKAQQQQQDDEVSIFCCLCTFVCPTGKKK